MKFKPKKIFIFFAIFFPTFLLILLYERVASDFFFSSISSRKLIAAAVYCSFFCGFITPILAKKYMIHLASSSLSWRNFWGRPEDIWYRDISSVRLVDLWGIPTKIEIVANKKSYTLAWFSKPEDVVSEIKKRVSVNDESMTSGNCSVR